MLPGNSPVVILKEGTQRDSGKKATQNNIAAAKAIAEAVRSTLGPKGMDKMLVDSMGDVIITNDGVTILKEVEVQHPAAKMIVEIAKTQDSGGNFQINRRSICSRCKVLRRKLERNSFN